MPKSSFVEKSFFNDEQAEEKKINKHKIRVLFLGDGKYLLLSFR